MAIYKLGEIIQVISGNSKLTKKYVDVNNGEFGVVSSSSFNNGIFGYINTFMYEKGITISKDGSIGNVFWQDKPFSINTGAFLVKPKDLSIISEKYLFFLLKTKEKRLKQIGDGSVIKHIYAKDINNLEAIIPDLKTQNSIIDIIEFWISKGGILMLNFFTKLKFKFFCVVPEENFKKLFLFFIK
ncbi:restriction endonuclease subunit S [Mesomycoplasma neurolyticum]|uniref:Restriction modification enzyme subunit S2A n=1 Tax=Mesomycoplasma neurolyticum TaxID=2120 RepID=A0A449A6Q7_9BACT|nr:restriction endonuclease subunit S [Mesomycoplasma neurolyticum]VEU59770.1 restriction modification enzyme subunit S2A [Mesomycoplasma neurolyticum]VEU59908.1 restriction modification enzyme subunit S2A [Mesomycoplasma neurolyticum]